MNHELYTYIQRMHQFVQSQEKRILELEKRLKTLSTELHDVKSRPPLQVGTIEYKFDQLKVETLEGTLNIGLNPSDLEGIEDFEVTNKNIAAHFSPKEKMKRSMDIEDSIYKYLETELPPLIRKYEDQLDIKVEDSYINFIREDIKKQLPVRVDYYLKQIPQKERSSIATDKIAEQIKVQIKKDIENGVLIFLKNLPSQKDDTT